MIKQFVKTIKYFKILIIIHLQKILQQGTSFIF